MQTSIQPVDGRRDARDGIPARHASDGLEHGPIDFFPNPPSADPDYQCRLAREGNYSGIVFHIGLASST